MKNKTLKYYLGLPYKIELKYEPSDNSWMATHPELGRGSCYAIGDTKEEALKLLEEEKRFVIKFGMKRGHEIPEPKYEEEDLTTKEILVKTPKTIHKKLLDISQKEGLSLNQYVVSVLSEKVGKKSFTYKTENPANKRRSSIDKKDAVTIPNNKLSGKVKTKSSKLRNIYSAQ